MKRKVALILAGVLSFSLLLAGCGDKEEETASGSSSGSSETESEEVEMDVYDTEFLMSVTDYDVTEYVTLGEYEGLAVEIDASYEITDESIGEFIQEYLDSTPYYTDVEGGAEDGNVVDIDYVGTMDGEEFDGGSDEDYELELGSDTFIDGFEDGLIGASAGDVVTLDLTFPDDYSDEDLAGQDVTFEVTVNAVYEVEYKTYENLTDDDVAEGFEEDYGFSTVEEFEEAAEASLESSLNNALQEAYQTALVENSEVTLPDEVLDAIQDSMDEIEETAESYDIEVDTYLNYFYGMTQEEYEEEMQQQYREMLVLEALVYELEVEVEDDVFDAMVDYLVDYYYDSYGYEAEDFYEMYGSKSDMILQYAEYYIVLTDLSADAEITYVESEDTEDEE